MKIIYLICLVLGSHLMFAQPIDQHRMQKDIEVAEQILATVIGQNMDGPGGLKNQYLIMHGHESIKGSYLDGYGVTFHVTTNPAHRIIAKQIVIRNRNGEDMKEEYDCEDDMEDRNQVFNEAAIKEFLADYGNLIHQLKPSDKIVVKSSNHGPQMMFVRGGNHGKMDMHPPTTSVEVEVEDLLAYESQDIERGELYDRITVRELVHDPAKEPQLHIFATMLERLYQSDLSDNYYLAKAPFFDREEGFGVTYHLKFYSSKVFDDNRYSLPTIGEKDLSEEKRNEIVEGMYPGFLKGLKAHLLDYAHILKNLDASEMLVLQIELTQCKGCDMPEEIEVAVKKAVIDGYRKGDLSLDKAMEAINVRNIR